MYVEIESKIIILVVKKATNLSLNIRKMTYQPTSRLDYGILPTEPDRECKDGVTIFRLEVSR